MNKFSEETNLPTPELSPEALSALKHHSFPGNIRELENMLERAFTLCDGNQIEEENLQLSSSEGIGSLNIERGTAARYTPGEFNSLDDYLAETEKEILMAALERNRWNRTATAEELGISFRQIRHKLKKYGIE